MVIVPGTTIWSSRSSSSDCGSSRDDDRPVAGSDARTVREQGVVLLNERVGGKRDRGDLEASDARPLVQRLDVAQDLLELVTAGVDEIRRERPVHERVVGIGAVADADLQAPDASTAPATSG